MASSRGGWSRDARTSERIGRALGPRGLALGRGEEIEGRAERLGDVALRPALRGLRLRRRPARDAGASARGLPGHGRGRAHGRRAHVRAVVGVSCDDDGRRGGRERQARASGREQRRGRRASPDYLKRERGERASPGSKARAPPTDPGASCVGSPIGWSPSCCDMAALHDRVALWRPGGLEPALSSALAEAGTISARVRSPRSIGKHSSTKARLDRRDFHRSLPFDASFSVSNFPRVLFAS